MRQLDETDAELIAFRQSLHRCLNPWGDALFELCDAVLCSPSRVNSVPALSLEPEFRRSHGSLYKALAEGAFDEDRLRRLLLDYRPPGWPNVFALDASTWARVDAATSPERGFHYSASRHSGVHPFVPGWSFQWISQLDWAHDSWTAPLDVVRVRPTDNATDATIRQVLRLVENLEEDSGLGVAPLFVFDAGYDPIAIGDGLSEVHAQALVRISSKRVFYLDPAPASGARGRPRRHGARVALSDPKTWPIPDGEINAHDPRYGSLNVQVWHGLHPQLASKRRWATSDPLPIIRGSVLRVDVEHLPKRSVGVKKTLWLWWSGPGEPDLDLCWRAYLRRFDIEHTFRFVKSTLGWTTPALRTPEQAERWTWIVLAAYTQLRLARELVDDLRLPWEKRRRPSQLSPARVRRGFSRLRARIGTPAHPPKFDKPGTGRPKGTRRPPRTRYPVVKKAA
jgi:DDE superfamily endonuclease